MFMHTDPLGRLDLHHQRAAELAREAAAFRLARAAVAGRRHRRFGRWPRSERGGRSAQVSATA